jgi:hypothetical protein
MTRALEEGAMEVETMVAEGVTGEGIDFNSEI